MKQIMTKKQQEEALIQISKEDCLKYEIPEIQPKYYVQVNKTACRVIVKVNDLPLGYFFTKNDGQTMLYPINDNIFSSGAQTYSFDVYPRSNEDKICRQAWAELEIVYFPDRRMSISEKVILGKLTLPNKIGEQKLSFYTDSSTFNAKVPYDFSYILKNAKNLHKVPNLKQKVFKRYNEMRQYWVDCNAVACFREAKIQWIGGARSYLTEERITSILLESLDKDFNPALVGRKMEEINEENSEMHICGNGKAVLLINRESLDNVLRLTYFNNKKHFKNYPDAPTSWLCLFLMFYMPRGSNKLEILY